MARLPNWMRQRIEAQVNAKRSRRAALGCEALERRMLLAADPVISEFMALNTSTLRDGEERYSDWIEIHNPGDVAVDLGGWHLTDNTANPTKWTFPPTVVPAGGYLVVFASEDTSPPPGELHTNFRLSGDGEYLALVMPDGQTTTTEFNPYPQQVANIAYGLGVRSEETVRVSADGPVRAHVPTDGSLALDWTSAAFDDSSWTPGTGGVGYDLDGDYDALIGTDVEAAMHGVNPGAYVRSTFDVDDASLVDSLALDIQYDDGFVAYLNGEEVASRNAQSSAVSPASGLMSYWSFDGTTQDRSGDFANNSGTVADNLSPRGGVTRFVGGKVGQALAIGAQGGDATDFVAPLSADVQLPASYAIEAWVMPTELSDSWQRLVLNWGSVNAQHAYHFSIRNNSGFANSVSLYHGQTNGTEPNANGGTVVLNQWQHIAGVADGNFLRVYLNGVQVDAVPYDGTIHTTTTEGLGIGDSATALSTIKFNGLLDEVALWSVPLTASQVMSHFQAGALGYGLTPVGVNTELQWDSTAPLDRADGAATAVEAIDLSSLASFVQPGENVLAIHGLNSSASDRDFLIRAGLRSSNIVVDASSQRYFAVPTPGAPNGTGSADLGPIVRNVAHEILEPMGITSTTLVAANGPVQALVPTNDALGLDWTESGYAVGSHGETWATGTGGVGFDTIGDYDSHIGTDVESAMLGANASAFVRSTFDVSDPSAFDRLKLRMKYDDGFVAYLNGQPIASRNTPGVGGISPTTGLATYYSFDGTLADQAPLYTNNSGVAVDNLVATAAAGSLATTFGVGRVGQAVRVSRDSGAAAMLTAVDSNDLDLAADWTVEAWVKPDLANTGEWDRFATKWFPGTTSWHWAFRYGNNGQDLFLNGAQSINGQTGQPANSVPLDQWSHVAITGNSVAGTISAWLNGVVVATAPYVSVTNGDAPLTLGNFRITDTALQFSGLIDEFAIWRVALSEQQLLSHVSEGASGYGLNPVAGNPSGVAWNAAATAAHADAAATAFEEFDVSQFKSALVAGTNVLAIHGLNVSAADDDFLIVSELIGEAGSLTERPIRVTAEVLPTLEAVGSVALTYRRMFDAEQTAAMFDDGTHGDLLSGDGVFTATLSASVAAPGEMLRYAVTAADASAVSTRAPLFADPINSPQYFGTVINDPAIVTQLPVLHRFIQHEAAAETGGGTRGSLFYNGEFYDNVFIRIRGGTARAWPKKSYKIEFNDSDHFRFDPDLPRVDEFNLNTTYTDKAYVRAILSYELHRDSGGMGPITFPLRVEQNGQFFSVAHFVEQPDRDFLRRNGLDQDGALYKGTANPTNGLTGSASGAFDKKTRKDEDFSDLQALINGLALTGTSLENYIFDNVDLAAQVNFMAVNVLLQNIDATDKNFFIYRDTEGDGEWFMLPWDLDLVLGPNALNTDTIVAANDSPPGNTSHPYLGILSVPYHGRKNHLFDAIVNTPRTREMFLRRVRSLMDDFLNAASTPAAERYFEQRLDELVTLLGPDVLLDRARWGASAHFGGGTYTLQQAVDRIKNEYLTPRRNHLYVTHSADNQPSPVTTILASGAAAKAFVPTSGALGLTWTQRTGFDDSSWLAGTSGVGYDEDVTYSSLLGIDLRSTAIPAEQRIDANGDGTSENDSVYIRIPFNVTDPAALTQLKLRMKYDDGFVAYINGVKVAETNAPASPQWNSAATALHDDGAAVVFADFDLGAFDGAGGVLVAGQNILAIHGLNDMTNGAGTSSDMLLLPELVNGTPGFAGSVGIPSGQSEFPSIQFGAIDHNPASGNQDEEYIQLINPNPFAVDISGWKLSGGVEFTFAAGTVIPTGGVLYVAAEVSDFRARDSGPAGGQGLQVVGGYQGHISNFGETIELSVSTTLGDEFVVATTTTPSTPSDTQQFLRVTEIMYHPADPTAEEVDAGFTDADQFEFIELQNIGTTTTLNLSGVSFTGGVAFTFGDVQVPPGGYVVLAVNPAAFAQRYGAAITVTGQYTGNLNNGGEEIKLDDPDGSSIHDFTYDDTDPEWHPTADGGGYSLVIVDPLAAVDDWNLASAWRPSSVSGGSPGGPDSLPGDVDGNFRVDLVDLAILQRFFGLTSGAMHRQGDLNGDGAVTRADIAILAQNYGRSGANSPAPSAPASVVASARRGQELTDARRRLPVIAAHPRRRIAREAVDFALSDELAVPPRQGLSGFRARPTSSPSGLR